MARILPEAQRQKDRGNLAQRQATDTVRPSALGSMAAPELNAEQALGLVSYSLMQRLADQSQDPLPWMNAIHLKETDGLRQLRQRLELTALAIDTGAPLSTNEVTHLLGARPGADVVERGGLRARRGSRNLWRQTRLDADSRPSSSFSDDRFRRRL
jgi:hypothetical protein